MLNEELIKQVLTEQRDLLKVSSEFVEREALKEISKIVSIKHIVVVTGHRRSGKSVLLSQIIHKFYGKKNIFYINFDDERLIGLDVRDLNKIMEIQMMLFGENKTIFLDEIQNIDKWERFVSRLYNGGYKIYITGSNAKLLSSELATLLTGRHMDIEVYPFSFTELLKYRGVEVKE
ncbi:MAG: AAA family ATPase, partial [Elusimicrobia bacterium]|nr:AAA family ATPase [Elusimicrobiota bacterium]